MGSNKIVAIDLGTQNVRIDVALVSEGEKLEIVYHNDFKSAGINRGKVVNPARLGAVLKDAVASAEQYLGYKFTQAAVSCQKCEIRSMEKTVCLTLDSNSTISSETIEMLKDMACEEVAAELSDGEAILAATAQCYNAGEEMGVDVADLEGMMVENLEGRFKVFIGKTSSEKTIDAAFKEAGLNHISPVFCGAEIGNAVLNRNEKTNGAAIVDFGAGAISVYVFHAGVLRHYGAIPFGGNTITGDIRNLCDIDEHLAENIKLGYGGCMPERLASLGEKTLRIKDIDTGNKKEITAKYLSEIISARTRELVEAILYEIQVSGYADKLKNGIILTGGCAPMLNLCHFIKQLSGYNARLGSPSQNVFKSESKLFFTPNSAMSAALLLHTAKTSTTSFEGEPVRTGTMPGEEITSGYDDPVDNVLFPGKDNASQQDSNLLRLLFDQGSKEDKQRRDEEKKKRDEEKKAEKERKLAEKKKREEEKALRKKKEEENESQESGFGGLFKTIFDDDFK